MASIKSINGNDLRDSRLDTFMADGTVRQFLLSSEYPANTAYLFDSVGVDANKVLNGNETSTDINNYLSYAVTSSVASMSKPVRLRNIDGSLVFRSISLENGANTSKNPQVVCTYSETGGYLRKVTRAAFMAREKPVLDDEFFGIFFEYNNFDIKWRVEAQGVERVYNVGLNGDWTSVTEAISALSGDCSKKTLLIEGGEYDIFEEMGGETYIDSLENPESLNWRDVCPVVPPNTRIKGVGSVTLEWLPTASQIGSNSIAHLFAPLNVSGSCEIENIKIRMRNGRYGIHDETSGSKQYFGSEHIYRNVDVEVIEDGQEYGGTSAFGCGHSGRMYFKFEGCRFKSFAEDVWWMHDWSTSQYDCSTIEFDWCEFLLGDGPASPLFRTDSTSTGRLDNVVFRGCMLGGVRHDTTTSKLIQAYAIKTMLCPQITETASGGIVITTPIEQCLTIPAE